MSKLRQAEMTSDGDRDLMLLGVKANGAVKGRLLVMTLEQRYRNSSDTNAEITYTFPLPFGAVLMGVEVVLNGKPLKGEVTEKSHARARYEEALSEGNSGVMLERNADHSYTLELGNLMAREECSITVRYAQVLQVEQGQIRLMLPTTIAPRYGDPISQGGLQPHQTTITDLSAEYSFDISVTLYGDLAKANVACPSHATGYFPNGEELVVRLAQRGALDRDFILTLSDLQNASSAISCEDMCVSGQTAAMANFSPALTVQSKNAVSAKILVDCSGSMSGDSIDSARRALRSIINGLEKADCFSLSRFGSSVEHRSRGMWNAAAPAKASALRWIDEVKADLGGTEMAEALKSTIAITHKGKSDILLITDGEISGIGEVINIAKKSDHRVFVVAIGASPAEAHLRRLAHATGGVCDFVAPGEDVEPAVVRMFHRLRATPVRALRVEWPSTMAPKWVQRLPDHAFENDALSVCAFVNTPSSPKLGEVKLWGRLPDAQDEVLLARATLENVQSTVNTLARVAASALYAESTAEPRVSGDKTGQPTAQEVAVLYQLVTDSTNFILVHERTEAKKALEMPEGHKVPQMLAAGWGGTGTVSRSEWLTRGNDKPMSVPDDYASISSCVSSARFRSSDSPIAASFSVCEPAPSVWRQNRSSAASRVDAMSSGGIDDFQIPAFLRKQAGDSPNERTQSRRGIDKLNPTFWRGASATEASKAKYLSPALYTGITPAGFAEWLRINHQSVWPTTYGELRDIGLGLAICEWLEFEVGADAVERIVVTTFTTVIKDFGFVKLGGLHSTIQAIKGIVLSDNAIPTYGDIAARIRSGLKEIQPGKWPNSVANFPESAMA
jgi:Ca-activated chloride channel family protein